MKRLLLVLALSLPIFASGLIAVGITAWALVALGLNGLVTPLLVLGLSAAVPLSIVAADHLVPGVSGGVGPVLSCPSCGSPLAIGLAHKPAPLRDL